MAQPELGDKAAQEIAHLFEAYLKHNNSLDNNQSCSSALQRLVKEFSSVKGEANPFAIASREIVDTLTKQWSGGGAAAATASSQLKQKQRRHASYLRFLQDTSTWEQLHESTRLAILEHGEKTAGMLALREVHNYFSEQRWANRDNNDDNDIDNTHMQEERNNTTHAGRALRDIIQHVWESERQLSSLLAGRDPAEVLYARVSHIGSFFAALHSRAKRLVADVPDAAVAFDYLTELSEAAAAAVNAVLDYQAEVTDRLLPSSPPSWLTSLSDVRLALRSLIEATIMMRLRLRADAPTLTTTLIEQLLGLAEMGMGIYRRAVDVALFNNQDASSLRDAYVELRDNIDDGIMPTLLNDAFEAAEEAGQRGGPVVAEATLKDKLAAMRPLAEQHYAYDALAEICERAGDYDGLFHYMEVMRDAQEQRGDGRFSTYVFERFVRTERYAELLTLRPQFNAELEAFLRDRWDLAWLHQVRMHKYRAAADTLSKLSTQSGRTLLQRKRALCVGKIARLAERDIDEVASIDAALELVQVQMELQGRDAPGNVALEPLELVEACLAAVRDDDNINTTSSSSSSSLQRRRAAVLAAFHVFAAAGSEFRQRNQSLMQRAWLEVSQLDDWSGIQLRRAEMSDSRYVDTLRATAIYAAAVRCYGQQQGLVGVEEPLHHVMPIESVEELLMANMRADQSGADALLEALRQAAVDVGVMQ